MNTASLTDAIVDHVPSKSAAAATIASTWDDISEHLPDIDVSRAARRTRRTMSRYVPGMRERRSSRMRWLLIGGAIVAVVAAVVVARRRADSVAEQRRDDWKVPTDGDSQHAAADREPATAPV